MDTIDAQNSFFARPKARLEIIPMGEGVPLGIESVVNPELNIGGAYGSWGKSFDNQNLPQLIAERLGEPLAANEQLNLAELGFENRFHSPVLPDKEAVELEIQVGVRFLREAMQVNGWQPSEVEGVLIGSTGPASFDYTERIASEVGIPEEALKVSIHKACDGSVAGLNLALNPELPVNRQLPFNIAERLFGKKVLVGGIEGLSRLVQIGSDKNALQLFGNGAGVIGLIPGKTMKFIVGITHDVFDAEGVLQVHMYYPRSKQNTGPESLVEVIQSGYNSIRIAGLMNEPQDGSPVVMAGPMGMVKLFVRTGVQVVKEAYEAYQKRLAELEMPGKKLAVAIVHHANFKINQLLEKQLLKEGIQIPMPWLLREFGNVSAASNMIAFLRQLPNLKPGDHILIDGFGAGTYYDVVAIEL